MRLISDTLEHRGVDIVFNGHFITISARVRSRFLAKPAADRTFKAASSYVIDGDFEIDEQFDGVKDTTPDGVLNIVTGAGGAGAYDPDQTDNVPTWQPYTMKRVSDVYSFTVVDVDGAQLTLRQISETCDELDRIVVSKPARLPATPGLQR
jgi:hypothetical protein